MRKLSFLEFGGLFHLRSAGLWCGLAAVGICAVSGRASLGVVIGFGLFALNVLFLYESGRSLLGGTSRGRARRIAFFSGLGRFLFLAVSLGLVAGLGAEALLGACGGLLLGQANLHVATLLKRGVGRCSST